MIRRMDVGKSVYTLAGDKVERNIVGKILGLHDSWENTTDREIYFYQSLVVLALTSPND